jgi:hypothetical protein
MARNNPEFKVQVAIVKYLRLVMPNAIVQHCVNEVNKRGTAGMLQATRNKSAGVFTGFPDLVVFLGADQGPFFLEVKSKTGTTSEGQKIAHQMLRNLGYGVAVVKSIDDVREFLNNEGIPHKDVAA